MKKNSNHDYFPIVGLSDREALVWHVLSEMHFMHVSGIAQATKLHRPAIYQVIVSLMEKKLVQESHESGRKYYSVTGAVALEKFRARHDKQFEKHLSLLKPIEESTSSKEIRVYHGKEIKKVWEDVLASPKGTIFYRYDAYAPSVSVAKYMPPGYYERLEKNKMERFVITNDGLRKAAHKKRMECASRMLPKSMNAFEQGICQFLLDDKFVLVDFNTETAFIITNPAIVAFQKQLFQGLFRLLKE